MTSVEDVWDRDLLHVSFDPETTTTAKLLERIEKEGFKGELK